MFINLFSGGKRFYTTPKNNSKHCFVFLYLFAILKSSVRELSTYFSFLCLFTLPRMMKICSLNVLNPKNVFLIHTPFKY